MIERRLYFVLGDVACALVVGGVAGALGASLVSPAWNMWLAMGVGMVAGMLVATPLAFAFLPLFGAMEVMVPAMTCGMFSGMWMAMAGAMRPLGAGAGLRGGMLIGLLVLAAIYALNAWLQVRGDRRAPGGAA